MVPRRRTFPPAHFWPRSEQDILVWTLADLGVAPGAARQADRPLEYGPARPPPSAAPSCRPARSRAAGVRPHPRAGGGLA